MPCDSTGGRDALRLLCPVANMPHGGQKHTWIHFCLFVDFNPKWSRTSIFERESVREVKGPPNQDFWILVGPVTVMP